MPISVPCPRCEAVWPANEELLGKAVYCPRCRYELPIPDFSDEQPDDVVLHYHKGDAWYAALGYAVLVVAGICILATIHDPLAVAGSALLLLIGLIGTLVYGRKLRQETPPLMLTREGIVQGDRDPLAWATIQAVRLRVSDAESDSVLTETLHVSVVDDSGAVAELVFDVHGLELDSHSVARLVMQRVLRINPQATVKVRDYTESPEKLRDVRVDPDA